ncbi:unnamed protein product [Rhizoctonia solani]|uniref:Uncharacterized protein n=1 Tax=Rhizoctonia solani TaxID=456999 RepID=A0A8H2XDI3_9AGAM|nr:unnamed protein product [Rhizoctonia solani]
MAQPGDTQIDPQAESQRRPWVGSDTARYKPWIEQIPWNKEIRLLDSKKYDQLPEGKKLQELVARSLIVSEWLSNKESPQCGPYCNRMKCFSEDVTFFPNIFGLNHTKEPNDPGLSSEVEECLPFILLIRRSTEILQKSLLKSMDSDRRHPLDTLGTLVWDVQSNGDIVYRTHQQLQIPGPASYFPRPDGCAYIPIPDTLRRSVPNVFRPALSCFARSEDSVPECRYAPHWVTEFKRDLGTPASQGQVVEGLVSALYQRRALGFPNHLVFGTAHYNEVVLEVLAATWVPSDEPVKPEDQSAREVNVESTVLPAGQANDSLANSLQVGNTTPTAVEEVADENAKLTIKDIKKYNKIVVYRIDIYDMTDIGSLLRLYLLMRQTRILAQQYTDEIKKFSVARILQLSSEAGGIYKWAPPPLSGSAKRKRSNDWHSELGSMTEEPEDMMFDRSYESASRSDSEECNSFSDIAPTHTIHGEVAAYTVKNYAQETNRGACVPKYQSAGSHHKQV